MGEGRVDEAAALYVRASELAPQSDELLFWAGLAIAQQGDVAAGADAVRRAAEVHPGWLTLLERLSPDFAPAGEAVMERLEEGFRLPGESARSSRASPAGDALAARRDASAAGSPTPARPGRARCG